MRRITMLSLAVAGLFVLTSATAARANWYHKSEGAGGSTSEMTSPSSEPEMKAPEVGSYERQEATEAGKLPSGEWTAGSGSEPRGDLIFRTFEPKEAIDPARVDTGP